MPVQISHKHFDTCEHLSAFRQTQTTTRVAIWKLSCYNECFLLLGDYNTMFIIDKRQKHHSIWWFKAYALKIVMFARKWLLSILVVFYSGFRIICVLQYVLMFRISLFPPLIRIVFTSPKHVLVWACPLPVTNEVVTLELKLYNGKLNWPFYWAVGPVAWEKNHFLIGFRNNTSFETVTDQCNSYVLLD